MDSFLTLLGLCFRAGKLCIGEAPVREALDAGKARAVFLAADAGAHTRRKAEPRLGAAALWDVPASKAEMGKALGRNSCAICAVTDKGFAKSLAERLAPLNNTDPDGGVTI